jgi:hypothetical protein
MSVIDGLMVVQRSIPTDVLAGLATGQFSLHGGVIRNGAGQIVRHLVSTAPATALNPFGMISAVPSLVNVYQLHHLTQMTQALMQISQATMMLSGLNLAVSVVGFGAMLAGLRRVDERIKALDQKVDWIKLFLATERRAKLLNAIEELSRLATQERNAHAILHTARTSLGEARMCYLEHWDNSKCLEESMSYQHYFCTAFLAQARCFAEMQEYDDAVDVFKVGMQQWQERARAIASDQILAENRARFLEARYAKTEKVSTAKVVGWMDFAYEETKGYQWIDILRREHDSSFLNFSRGKIKKEDERDILYLDNLTSRDAILKGYEAQLQCFADNEIRPSEFANALRELRDTNPGSDMLFLAPVEDICRLEFDNKPSDGISVSLADFRKEIESTQDVDEFAGIEPDEFLRQLGNLEKENLGKRYRFIGLGWFVKTHLCDQGYDINTSYGIANSLEKKGLVEIYKVDNSKGDHSVAAIKLADSDK